MDVTNAIKEMEIKKVNDFHCCLKKIKKLLDEENLIDINIGLVYAIDNMGFWEKQQEFYKSLLKTMEFIEHFHSKFKE